MISLVLPAFNPGASVDRTWEAVREFLGRRTESWEVLFVLDGCTDGSPERIAGLMQADPDPRIRILHYLPNRGKGHAVRVGLRAAAGEYRIFTDIDLAYGFDDVSRIADALLAGARVAIASREHPDSLVQLRPRHLGYAYRRRIQSGIFGGLARMLLPITQHDTQAGLKGMTAAVADMLMPRLRCDGFGFDCELLTACTRYEIPVVEVPVCVRYDEEAASTTSAGGTVRMLKELWKIRKLWSAKKPRPEPLPLDVDVKSVEMLQTVGQKSAAKAA